MPDQIPDRLDAGAALAELRQHIPTLERLLRAARRWEQHLAAPPPDRPGNGPERTTGPCCGIPACGGGCGVNDPLPDTGVAHQDALRGEQQRRCQTIHPRHGQCQLYAGHLDDDSGLERHRSGSMLWLTTAEIEASGQPSLTSFAGAWADNGTPGAADDATGGTGWDRAAVELASDPTASTGLSEATLDEIEGTFRSWREEGVPGPWDYGLALGGEVRRLRAELAKRDREVQVLNAVAAGHRDARNGLRAQIHGAKAVAFTAEAMLSVVRDWLRETGQRPPGPVRGALDLVEAALDQAAKAGGTTAAPTTWALPPEPGPEVRAVWGVASGAQWTRRPGDTWLHQDDDPDSHGVPWLDLLEVEGAVSSTPPAGTCRNCHGTGAAEHPDVPVTTCEDCRGDGQDGPPAGTEAPEVDRG